MTPADITPASVLFQLLKQQGGVSHKELAGLILSGRPLSDGRSPQSRIDDRTWVSRFVVHAQPATLTDQYFCDFTVGALRVASRMKSRERRALSSQAIIDMVCGPAGRAMDDALRTHGQDPVPYRNLLARIAAEGGLCADERAEVAMVLLITVALTCDVRRAVAEAQDFARDAYGGRLVTPPMAMARSGEGEGRTEGSDAAGVLKPVLGLLRVRDGYVTGGPHWLDPGAGGSEVGSLALAEGSVCAVDEDVSARHARIWRAEDGAWYVEGLDSKNGAVLESALTGETIVVEPPRGQRADFTPKPQKIAPGDTLTLGATTTFVVIEGLPE